MTHVGINWNYSSKSSVGLYVGTNFHLKEEQHRCIGLSYSHIYLKPLFWKIRPGFPIKPQYWTQDDENYTFSNMAMIVWVVNEPADIASVWAVKPDIIETDNPDFKKYIPVN